MDSAEVMTKILPSFKQMVPSIVGESDSFSLIVCLIFPRAGGVITFFTTERIIHKVQADKHMRVAKDYS